MTLDKPLQGGEVPTVEVESTLGRTFGQTVLQDLQITHEGQIIGEGRVANSAETNETWVTQLKLDEPFAVDGGYDVAVYRWALHFARERGEIFRSDPRVTREAEVAIWQRLGAEGLVEIVEPFEHSITLGVNATPIPVYDGYARALPAA